MFCPCHVKMKSEVILVLFLTYTSLFNRCQALYLQYRPQVTISVGTFTAFEVGRYAEYSNYEANIVPSGLALIPEVGFGCTSSLSRNASQAISSVSAGSFVVMIPMDLSQCSDYRKATFAKLRGASGVLFYYPGSGSRKFSSGSGLDRLSIPVAAIQFSEDSLTSLQEELRSNNDTSRVVSIIGDYYQSIKTSQTFYFVVFSFCILTLLSCLWFLLSYLRKCRSRAQRRRRRAQTERETRQLVNNLPTKTHKSQLGVEEPTCAICLEIFHNKDTIRVLPCQHEFHKRCIDPWLKLKRTCPMCKEDISIKNKAAKERKAADISSDEASSVGLLSHGASHLSLESTSSSEQTDSVAGSRVSVDDGVVNVEHTVVMFEQEPADHVTPSPPNQQTSSEGEVAVELQPVE